MEISSLDIVSLAVYGLGMCTVLLGLAVLVRSRGVRRLLGLGLILAGVSTSLLLTLLGSNVKAASGASLIDVTFRQLVPHVVSLVGAVLAGGLFALAIVGGLVWAMRAPRAGSKRPMPAIAKAGVIALSIAVFIGLNASAFVWLIYESTRRTQNIQSPSASASAESKAPKALAIAPGFSILKFYQGEIKSPTSLVFGPDKNLYVADYIGRVWKLGRNVVTGEQQAVLYVEGFAVPRGIAWHKDELYVASRGKVSVVRDTNKDGKGDTVQDIVTDLPSDIYPWHGNNGIAFGPDGRLYFAVGSTSNAAVETYRWASSVLSVNPDGSDLRVFATGVRNPYDLAFNADGSLFATDNGLTGNDIFPPDRFDHIVAGEDYGFPKYDFLPDPASGSREPVAVFPVHSSANGVTFYEKDQFPARYRGNAFVALWNSGSIARVELAQSASDSYVGRVTLFATGFARPIDVTVGPDGSLYMADFESSIIYRISHG